MNTLPLYQVDAFSDRPFGGNPAAVCPLEAWLPTPLMQAIAAENNLSETAFVVPEGDGFGLRWFTPGMEVDLCGHATLATAYVLYHRRGVPEARLKFFTRSGELRVRIAGDWLELDFPAQPPRPAPLPAELLDALPFTPGPSYLATDYLIELASEATLRALDLNLSGLDCLGRGLILTARSERAGVDFVSRWFGGRESGIVEDPVTGSAHCVLMPYWADKLGRRRLRAEQVSRRLGVLECELVGERVLIRGQARLFLEGTLYLPPEAG